MMMESSFVVAVASRDLVLAVVAKIVVAFGLAAAVRFVAE